MYDSEKEDAQAMDKLKMHSPDPSQENIAKIRELFPGCVTEAHDKATGQLRLAVDFDQLRQELSDHIVEGPLYVSPFISLIFDMI